MQQRITFVDNWNTIEQVCLASAVRLFGETNWSTVCNFLKARFSLIERPGNWLTPESCKAQYQWLSDKYVKMEISCERPVNQILQNLKLIGKEESQSVLEQENKYKESREKIELFAKNEIDTDTAMGYYEEALKRYKEREENLKKQGLKSDLPNISKSLVKQDNKTDGSSPLTTSPLLSSLLNNPPAVQYRPTLSTASFIPTKTAQGSSRASFDKAHTLDISHRSAFSPSVGSQSSSLSERSGLFSSSISPARKLDFQDPSISALATSSEQLSKESSKDVTNCDEAIVKSNIDNLENINLIPAAEEYLTEADIPQEMLLQVIGNLEGKQLLDKVLDELTGEKDVILEKDINNVAIPLDDSFVTNTSPSKDPVSLLTLPPESKSGVVIDSSVTNTDFKNTGHQYEAAQNIIIIDQPTNEQVIEGVNISNAEKSPVVETVTINTDSSSFLSVAISSASESISEPKSDLEPLVEYLDTSAVRRDNKNWQTVDNIQIKEEIYTKSVNKAEVSQITIGEISNESDETRGSAEGYETCKSTPDTSGTCDISIPGEPSLPENKLLAEIPDTETEVTLQIEEQTIEEVKEISKELESKETTVESDISLNIKIDDCLDLDNIPLKALKQIEKEKLDALKSKSIDNDTSLKTELHHENVDKTEELLPEIVSVPSKISKSVVEIEETAGSDRTSSVLPTIKEELRSNQIEDKPTEVKPKNPVEISESHEDTKPMSAAKNKRQQTRRRRSTVSESNEITKIAKVVSEEVESSKKEEVDTKKTAGTKEINITIKDFQTEGLNSEITRALLKSQEERLQEPPQPAQVTPTKTRVDKEKSVSKSVDTKKVKQKPTISRRSSIRTQSQNICTIKTEDASPSTSMSRAIDNAAQATRKKSLVFAQQRLATQKYSSAFLKPVSNKNVAGYEDVIYSPLDLQAIKRKIDSRLISTVTEFQRDVLLMILNAKMFNPINSQVYNMAVEMQKEALQDIQLTVQTLGEGVLFEMDDVSEKARKRQSVENLKKDQKANKRSKPSNKDECPPVKKIKLEENESTA